MKKPKIKPEVVWMPWHRDCGFVFDSAGFNKKRSIRAHTGDGMVLWSTMRKQGWRIVKVRISECKK